MRVCYPRRARARHRSAGDGRKVLEFAHSSLRLRDRARALLLARLRDRSGEISSVPRDLLRHFASRVGVGEPATRAQVRTSARARATRTATIEGRRRGERTTVTTEDDAAHAHTKKSTPADRPLQYTSRVASSRRERARAGHRRRPGPARVFIHSTPRKNDTYWNTQKRATPPRVCLRATTTNARRSVTVRSAGDDPSTGSRSLSSERARAARVDDGRRRTNGVGVEALKVVGFSHPVFRLSNARAERGCNVKYPEHTHKNVTVVTSTTSHLWVTFDRPLPPPASGIRRQMDARDVVWQVRSGGRRGRGRWDRFVPSFGGGSAGEGGERVVARGGGSTVHSSSASSASRSCVVCMQKAKIPDVTLLTESSSSATRMGAEMRWRR